MGWGEAGYIPAAVDEHFKLGAKSLSQAIDESSLRGERIIAVVASACSTATGRYDNLQEIGELCRMKGLWFHVDGAHGAAALLSEKYRHLLAGVEQADSLVWDAHKMMLMPALITAVLFRDGKNSTKPFCTQASYIFEKDAEEEWFNLGHRTMECTKSMLAMKLYLCLKCLGTNFFAQYVERTFDITRAFAAMLKGCADFELGAEPESNIICFRYLGSDLHPTDELQAAIRARMLQDGSFYIVQTRLPQGLFLRCALMNPLTSENDLEALLVKIRELAR